MPGYDYKGLKSHSVLLRYLQLLKHRATSEIGKKSGEQDQGRLSDEGRELARKPNYLSFRNYLFIHKNGMWLDLFGPILLV
jgi:hypothetical protein